MCAARALPAGLSPTTSGRPKSQNLRLAAAVARSCTASAGAAKATRALSRTIPRTLQTRDGTRARPSDAATCVAELIARAADLNRLLRRLGASGLGLRADRDSPAEIVPGPKSVPDPVRERAPNLQSPLTAPNAAVVIE